MSGFTPVKRNTSSGELQTDHCEDGSTQHLSASAANHNYNLQVDKSTPQPSSAQLAFSATNSPAKSGHQQADNSIIKPPDQFRTAHFQSEDHQPIMHGKFFKMMLD